MELALTLPKYFLVLIDGDRLPIEEPRVLDYFRTFRDSLHDVEPDGKILFYEDASHQLTSRMWQYVFDVYRAYLRLGDDKCPLSIENTEGKLATLDRYDLLDLYTVARALDFYDSPRLLFRVIQTIVSHLLPLSVDEIMLKHMALPELEFNELAESEYKRRVMAQDYALSGYGLNENILHAIHHQRPRTTKVLGAGKAFSVIVTPNGVYGCGENAYDQLCQDGGLSVVNFEQLPIEGALAVACGTHHTLVNTVYGLFGMGSNMDGELGVGRQALRPGEDRMRRVVFRDRPLAVVLDMACGGSSSMILTSDGLYACGNNRGGQLGVGDFLNNYYTPTRVLLPCNVRVRSLSMAQDSSMFLTSDDGVYLCGITGGNKMFDIEEDRIAVPRRIGLSPEMDKPLKVCRGHRHAVLLTSVGLYGAGTTLAGALGKRDKDVVLVTNWREFSYGSLFTRKEIKSIFVGPYQTFVALHDGSLMVCGSDRLSTSHDFVKVSLPSPIITVAASIDHTLFLTQDGLYALGRNEEGQTGLDPALFGEIIRMPTKVVFPK